jgi:alkylmercury lyase
LEEPAVDTDTQQFAARFVNSLTGSPSLHMWLVRPLQTLLVAGEPVTVAALAAEARRTEEEIREALATMQDTEYDAEGRIVGFGLTFNPTPHRYQTNGRTLFTWCALDTLVFPAVLGHTAQVTSPCRATGEPVRLTATPDGPTNVEPATAVVSLVAPDAPSSVRTSFCNQVHFFASAEAAKGWLTEHPDARVLPVADAFEIGRPVIEQILSSGGPGTCC